MLSILFERTISFDVLYFLVKYRLQKSTKINSLSTVSGRGHGKFYFLEIQIFPRHDEINDECLIVLERAQLDAVVFARVDPRITLSEIHFAMI